MGVDNVLQFTVVTADGEERTANACSEQDLFWALRGGGGSAFGVLTSVTYKTHPALSNVVIGGITWKGSNAVETNAVTVAAIKLFPTLSKSNWSAYLTAVPFGQGDSGALVIQPNSPFGGEVAAGNYTGVNATFASLFGLGGTNVSAQYYAFPTYYSFVDTVITDVAIGVNSITGGRLLDENALTNKAEAIVTMATADPTTSGAFHLVAGGAVSTFAPDSVALHPYWRKAFVSFNFGTGWASNTTAVVKEALKTSLTSKIQALALLVGEDAASYTNEADAQEPQWRKAFWGPHYPRLLAIKSKVDPKNVFTCNRCVGSEL
ncbi:hypothetical protein BKA62DRAFT_308067 [Auriculariales sp. MPI-PUGE-AT-0066]|nr:hypothetical protein BKA62DRAFT_308067 [Auriculariales sp. MPI-PUGE-AT-0066]